MDEPKSETEMVCMDILVVVDVQPGYAPSDSHVEKVISVMESASREGKFIAILEMDYSSIGKTDPRIMEAANGKKYAVFLKKNQDGSEETLAGLELLRIQPKQIQVVGLYTQACVESTVSGMRRKLSPERVDVLPEATHPVPWMESYIRDPKLRQTPQQEAAADPIVSLEKEKVT